MSEWRAINGMTREEVIAFLTSDEAMAAETEQRLRESAAIVHLQAPPIP